MEKCIASRAEQRIWREAVGEVARRVGGGGGCKQAGERRLRKNGGERERGRARGDNREILVGSETSDTRGEQWLWGVSG